MGEVTADTNLLVVALPRGPGRAGILIIEHEAFVHIVADCLHPCPPTLDTAKQTPCRIRELVGLAVSAAEEINEHIIWKRINRVLVRLWKHRIGLTCIADEKICRYCK